MEYRRVLHRNTSFWVSAAVVAHTLWTSAAPAMTYPLYAAEWHLSPTATTGIFAIYPVLVVATLILFGDLSDHIGRRSTMLLGLAASIVGTLLFAVAPDPTWLYVGRAFMGIGVGLSASPSTAAMVEFGGSDGSAKASYITAAAQALGLAMAVLIGGALIQYAPLPMRTNFMVLDVVLVAIFAFTWFLPAHTRGEARGKWRPRLPYVPAGLRGVFTAATLGVTAAYSLGSLMLGLGAQIARDLIGSSNSLVNGAAMSIFAVVVALVAVTGRKLSAPRALVIGGLSSSAGLALIAAAAAQHTLVLFMASVICMGVGYSLLFSGGLKLLNASAPAHHRGATLSALYLVAYLLQGAIALALGMAATKWGLEVSVDIAVPGIGILNVLAVIFAIVAGRKASRLVAVGA